MKQLKFENQRNRPQTQQLKFKGKFILNNSQEKGKTSTNFNSYSKDNMPMLMKGLTMKAKNLQSQASLSPIKTKSQFLNERRQFSQQNSRDNFNSASPVKRNYQQSNNNISYESSDNTLKQFLSQINDDKKIKEIQLKLQQGRQKSLQQQEINRYFIFDGLAYVQAQAFIRNSLYSIICKIFLDVEMQGNLLRSLIRVIIDKGNTFKVNIIDQKEVLEVIFFKLKQYLKLFCNISQSQQIFFNSRIESLITLINQISLILLQEFGKQKEELGLRKSMFTDANFRNQVTKNEIQGLHENMNHFLQEFDFFMDAVDCFSMIQRHEPERKLERKQCFKLLKVRFLFGSLNEELRVHKRNYMFNKNKSEKKIVIQKDKRLRTKKETLARLNELMQQKFNFGKNCAGTRESKAFSSNKKLEFEEQLLFRAASENPVADNRTKIMQQRIQNPFLIPEIKQGVKIANQVLKIRLQAD